MLSLNGNRIVERMLERLFAALVNGPSLNARPHSSRQRVDFSHIGRLRDRSAEDVLRDLLGDKRQTKVVARVPAPKRRAYTKGNGNGDATAAEAAPSPLTPEEKAAQEAYSQQQVVITKVRPIAEDARIYENDTGVHCCR
jgi:hypothetical protein